MRLTSGFLRSTSFSREFWKLTCTSVYCNENVPEIYQIKILCVRLIKINKTNKFGKPVLLTETFPFQLLPFKVT